MTREGFTFSALVSVKKMRRKKSKDKPLEVSLEYEPTPNGEGRLNEIFKFLLSDKNECQENISLEQRR